MLLGGICFLVFLQAVPGKASYSLLESLNSTTLANTTEERCLYECADKVQIDQMHTDKEAFHDCMSNCSSSWIFEHGGGCPSYVANKVKNTSKAACNPREKNIELVEIRKLESSGEVAPYVYMSWKPCRGAIEKLKGYLIWLSFDALFSCSDYKLRHNLEENSQNYEMVFEFVAPLYYDLEYSIRLLAYPYLDISDAAEAPFKSSDCYSLNGPRSCFCDCDVLPPPKIDVVGYDVIVTFSTAKSCFEPSRYDVIRSCRSKNGIDLCDHVELDQLRHSSISSNQSIISRRYHDFYDSNEYLFDIQVTVLYEQWHICPRAQPASVNVKAWSPPEPNVSKNLFGDIVVSFKVPTDFNIKRFELMLLTYSVHDKKRKDGVAYIPDVVDVSDAKNGILSKRYYRLNDGVYAVQIKEVRNASHLFNMPEWGPRHNFDIESEIDVVILGIVLSFVVIMCLIILTCYCVKTGVIQQGRKFYQLVKDRSHLPGSYPDQPMPQSKKVFLIWQSDYRSIELERAQEDVIRRFVLFLTHVCGLEVTVDLYEQQNVSERFSSWLDEARTTADWIVFVCPHYDYSQEQQLKNGNFHRDFRYLERFFSERSNFITVIFEYAHHDITKDVRDLQKITSGTYHLMDNIDGFYFHTQGFSKTWYFAWWLLRHISAREYADTSQGRELDAALLALKMKLNEYDASPRSISIESCPSLSADSGRISHTCDTICDTVSEMYSPESFSIPPDTSFFEKKRPQCKSMASLVSNENEAKEAIMMLNQQASLEEPQTHFPQQNTADRSEEERERLWPPTPSRAFYSPDHSCVYHGHVFGEDCRRCDDDVSPNSRHSSESNEETLPKSPEVIELNIIENQSDNDESDSNGDSGVYPYSGDLEDTIV